MSVRLSCSACGQEFVAEGRSGRSVRCPACNSVMAAGITTGPSSTRAMPSRSYSPPPRRRRERSGGGTVGLILGIIALVLGIPALSISWVPFLCIAALIAAVIGLLAGIVGAAVALAQKGDGLALSLAGGGVNLLAVVVALLMTIITGALVAIGDDSPETASAPAPQANPIAGPQPQPQPGGQPAALARLAGWGQRVDPNNDCTFVERGEALDVTVPATAHDLSPEAGHIDAPRVMQEVVGDFTIQVKVCGVLHPTEPGTVPGHLAYTAAGLLVWSDERNYLRLERAGLSRQRRLSTYVSFEQRVNGGRGASPTLGIPDQDHYLRLVRRGDQLTPMVSTDGQNWRQFQTLEAALPERVSVGVHVINAASQQLQVRFEELKIEK